MKVSPTHADQQVISVNREARHHFFILETFEAGIVLLGSEVKSIRAGEINLKEGFARVRNGEMFLEGVHVNPYKYANRMNHEPIRTKKLLMHKREIIRIGNEVTQKKLSLVPLRVYFLKGKAKIELGLARGKKLHDKRDALRKEEAKRTIERSVRNR